MFKQNVNTFQNYLGITCFSTADIALYRASIRSPSSADGAFLCGTESRGIDIIFTNVALDTIGNATHLTIEQQLLRNNGFVKNCFWG